MTEAADRVIALIPKNSRETIRVTRGTFKGHDLVSVWIWTRGPDGQLIPTKAGVSFKPALLAEVIAALEAAWLDTAEPGVEVP